MHRNLEQVKYLNLLHFLFPNNDSIIYNNHHELFLFKIINFFDFTESIQNNDENIDYTIYEKMQKLNEKVSLILEHIIRDYSLWQCQK